MLFAGANDGGVHGFDAETGEELIYYVPRGVYTQLSQLTSQTYGHKYFADAPPAAGDAFLDGEWVTVVVGGLGAGGQGIYALNVTNPGDAGGSTSLFSESDADDLVLWDFTDKDDPHLGRTYGEPQIVKMPNGKWAAVIGNGYNNSEDDDTDGFCTDGDPDTYCRVSDTGHAYLFILFLEGPGNDGVWDLGTDYIRIDTGVGDVATPNGLSTPFVADANFDFVADLIVAGDVYGNVWRFDLLDSCEYSDTELRYLCSGDSGVSGATSNWKVAFEDNSAPAPLFVTNGGTLGTQTGQPITTRPLVSFHPVFPEQGFAVYFGTGKYLETGDNEDENQITQSYYAVWDKNDSAQPPATSAITLSDLFEQTVVEEVVQSFDGNGDGDTTDQEDPTVRARVTSNNTFTWRTGATASTDPNNPDFLGWYIDFVDPASTSNPQDNRGEKQVSDAILRDGLLIFTTLIPSDSPCEFGGNGWLMVLDSRDGSRPPEAPVDFNGDGLFNSADYVTLSDGSTVAAASGVQTTVGIVSTPGILSKYEDGVFPGVNYAYLSGSDGSVEKLDLNPGDLPFGRQSWIQVR
ncbi:MAG: PilC/PilY family type IV pilus protein [Candidatus Competibacteraceae bacterium]